MIVMPMIMLNGMYYGYTRFFKPFWLQYKGLAEAEAVIKEEREPT